MRTYMGYEWNTKGITHMNMKGIPREIEEDTRGMRSTCKWSFQRECKRNVKGVQRENKEWGYRNREQPDRYLYHDGIREQTFLSQTNTLCTDGSIPRNGYVADRCEVDSREPRNGAFSHRCEVEAFGRTGSSQRVLEINTHVEKAGKR